MGKTYDEIIEQMNWRVAFNREKEKYEQGSGLRSGNRGVEIGKNDGETAVQTNHIHMCFVYSCMCGHSDEGFL